MSDDTRDDMSDDTRDDTAPDPEFEQAVREALFDPVPAEVMARSIDLFEFWTIDAELAELVERANADVATAGVRSLGSIATMTFASAALVIELEYADGALQGQVLPAAAVAVTLRCATGETRQTVANVAGVFRFDDVGAGSWSLVVTGDPVPTETTWFTL